MGTKLRFIVANNPREMEDAIGILPFKVEIKSIYPSGGKIFCWFTVHDDQSTFAIDLQKESNEVPTKKPRGRKSKKTIE